MREEYLNKLDEYTRELECAINQYNYISSANIDNNYIGNVDSLIMRINGLEMMINSVYAQAKANC